MRIDWMGRHELEDELTAARKNVLEESDRQLLLMALAKLSIERPGFDYALNKLACRYDNIVEDRATMYDSFRKLYLT